MGKIIETKINRFDGGMANDPRDPRENTSRVIKHFDNYTYPFKLVPHRSFEVDAASEATLDEFRIQRMLVANSKIYGSGVVSSADAHTQIYTKTTPTDPTAAWTTASNGTSASSVATNYLFLLYQNYLYGSNTAGVWKYGDISGTPSFTHNAYTSRVPTGQGLVHSKTDIMYFPVSNVVVKNNSGSFSDGLSLPVNSVISGMCEKDDYLAIATNQPDNSATVYLWDQNSTLNTISEKIDWGFGTLVAIENIGGTLVGISYIGNSSTSLSPTLYFKYWNGSSVVVFEKFICDSINIISEKQRFNDLFYFLAEITINSELLFGVWKIFKKPSGEVAVSFDRSPRNDTSLVSTGKLKGFYRWGDYMFVSYINPSDSKYTIWRTDNQATYTATSVYESKKFNAGDSSLKKDLVGATVTTEPLLTSGQVVLEYKANEDSGWTNIFTESTDNSISYSAVASLPKDYKEIQFRIESTGGAEITGISFKEEITGKRNYE